MRDGRFELSTALSELMVFHPLRLEQSTYSTAYG